MLRSKFLAGLGVAMSLAACAAPPEAPSGPHPLIWPCATVHQELQQQENANKQARQAQDTITWIPVLGIAGFAIKPDRTREMHLRTRAYECKQRAGL